MTTKNTLLFTLTAAAGWLVFTSNSGGLGNSGGGDASAAGCSCHAANNSNTQVILFSLTGINGTPATTSNQYTPGGQYVVSIVAKNNSGNTALTHFGLQTTARLVSSGGPGNAGLLSTGGTTNQHIYVASGLTGVEHSAPIPAVSSAPSNFQTSFLWTAPQAGLGAVTFFTAINLVNNNDGTTGDQPTVHSVTFQQGPAAGTEDVNATTALTLSPSPATDRFSLDTRAWPTGNYSVCVVSSTSRMVARHTIAHRRGTERVEVILPALPTGLYGVRVTSEGVAQCAPLFIR